MLRSDFFAGLSSDPVMPAILMKAQRESELDAEEEFRLRNFYMQLFVNWQWEWGEHKLGRIEAPIGAWRRLMLMESTEPVSRYPGLRRAWETNKYAFTPEFIDFMDNQLLDSNDR